MKLYSKNEYAEAWTGSQRQPFVIHARHAVDSRAGLSMDLLKCAVEGGARFTPVEVQQLAIAVCDLSLAIHEEWDKRGWTIETPPMDMEDDNPVGFERR